MSSSSEILSSGSFSSSPARIEEGDGVSSGSSPNKVDSIKLSVKNPIEQLQLDCPRARITAALLRISHDESQFSLSPKQVRQISARVYDHIKEELEALKTSDDLPISEASSSDDEIEESRKSPHEVIDETIQQSKLMRCGDQPILQLPVPLGGGQNGVVMLGVVSNGKCAIKPRSGNSPQSIKTEKAEIDALQTLSDVPGVINLVAVNDSFIVLEYCDANLDYLIGCIHEGSYELPDGALHNFCKQIATSISEMHEKGVIHSDLKPGNIMVIMEGDVLKISDFNFSVNNPEEIHGGSFIYYPPEQLANIHYEYNYNWDQKHARDKWKSKEEELKSALEEKDLTKTKNLVSEIENIESKLAPELSPAIDIWSGGLVMAQLGEKYLSEQFKQRLNEYITAMESCANFSGGDLLVYAALASTYLEEWQTEWVEESEFGEQAGVFSGLKPTNEIERLLTRALCFDPSTRISSHEMKQQILDLEKEGRFLFSPIERAMSVL